jgi:fucose permease
MEKQFGYSPLEAGIGILPFLGVFALVSFASGPLYNRLGAKPLAVFGVACITVAPFLFSQVDSGSDYGSLVPGMIVLGLGVGSFYPTATTAGVTSVDESQSSLAGGIVYMFQVAGGSVGLGLTTTVFTTASDDRLQSAASGLSDSEIDDVQGALAGTESAAEVLGRHAARTADRLVELVREAFVAGLSWSFRLVALLALCGLVVSLLYVGGQGARQQQQ